MMAAQYMRFAATIIFDDKTSVTWSWPHRQYGVGFDKRFVKDMTPEQIRAERRQMRAALEDMLNTVLEGDGE